MSDEKEVRILHGSKRQKAEEIQQQIREAILPFFPEHADDMVPAVCGALAEHSYVAVTNGTDLLVIWDSGQGIAIANYPNVGFIQRPSATLPYFLLIAGEMGLKHLVPDEPYIALFRSKLAN